MLDDEDDHEQQQPEHQAEQKQDVLPPAGSLANQVSFGHSTHAPPKNGPQQAMLNPTPFQMVLPIPILGVFMLVPCLPCQPLHQPVPDARADMFCHKFRKGYCPRGENCPYRHVEGVPRRVKTQSRHAAEWLFWEFKNSNASDEEQWNRLKELISEPDLKYAWRHFKNNAAHWQQNPPKHPAQRQGANQKF
eukprot:CAMPEP_0206463778 /NCGR_PEP_ID=MMETSP0324_2-20121206/26808_1 /ASSEMBLY_ACC=CAM_ASM_000836 /TAXON_ID=2866 /ORGANISM="Crypthecodinium cohnii, Strain Seligo" /LENGTH=190 /DNA_ID=CAMNT_0053936253 /DNA_START=132 /DNA_END=704 /DNA_ORIENTATION=-